MCGDAPPPAYCGPGDAHSQQEWIWRRADYQALFAAAPRGTVRLESTPFYLYLPDARRRIAEELPDARLIAVIRDPIDRAYSNWMHLWVDGLEPMLTSSRAWQAEDQRVARRLGAVLALPSAGPVRRAAGRPVRPGRPRPGAGAALPRAGGRSRPRRWTGLPRSSGSRRTRSGTVPPDNSRPLRRARACGPRARPGDPGRRRCRARTSRRRSGGRRASRCWRRCSTAARSSGRDSTPNARAELVRDCLRRHRRPGGGPRRVLRGLALQRRPRLLQERAAEPQPRHVPAGPPHAPAHPIAPADLPGCAGAIWVCGSGWRRTRRYGGRDGGRSAEEVIRSWEPSARAASK